MAGPQDTAQLCPHCVTSGKSAPPLSPAPPSKVGTAGYLPLRGALKIEVIHREASGIAVEAGCVDKWTERSVVWLGPGDLGDPWDGPHTPPLLRGRESCAPSWSGRAGLPQEVIMEVIHGSICSTPSPCPHGLERHSQGWPQGQAGPHLRPSRGSLDSLTLPAQPL